jgi:hypothetical protein
MTDIHSSTPLLLHSALPFRRLEAGKTGAQDHLYQSPMGTHAYRKHTASSTPRTGRYDATEDYHEAEM